MDATTKASIQMFELFRDFVQQWKEETEARGLIPTADELMETIDEMVFRLKKDA